MIYLDDIKYLKLYKKKFYLPVNKTDKRKNSAILLLTPNYGSSLSLIRDNKFSVNLGNYFNSYYIEKDIMYTINNEHSLEVDHYDYTNIINEQAQVFTETTNVKNFDSEEYCINEVYCKLGDKIIFFNELYDDQVFNEVAGNNAKYKRLLYNDRIRNNKEMFRLYDAIKRDAPFIKNTYITYKKYKNKNIFIDLYYYNQTYLNNNNFTVRKSVDMYFEFIRRFIMDKRIDNAGYTKKTVFVPINGWNNGEFYVYDYLKTLNPISVFNKKIKLNITDMNSFGDIDFIFFGKNGYFKFNPSKVVVQDYTLFQRLIKKLVDNEPIIDDNTEKDNSADAITANIVDKVENSKGITIHSLTGEKLSNDEQEELKAELVTKIKQAADNSVDEEEALEKLDDDESVKKLLSDLEDSSEYGVQLSPARLSRINKAQDEFMKKKIQNKTVKELIEDTNKVEELPETALPIKTINEEWKHLKAVNFEKTYDLNADIVRCLNSLSDTNKTYPVSILNVDVEDTSNSEDLKYTYRVKCESYNGKRFSLVFDIPKFRDNRFLRLRGNDKIFTAEMPLIPISKTDEDTVQIATSYNKVFILRYYTSKGKSNASTDRLIKALNKYDGNDIKIITGDNTKICEKYQLPIDYIDLAKCYSKITIKSKQLKDTVTLYFNQDEIREIAKVDNKKGIPVGIDGNNNVIYYKDENNSLISEYITAIIQRNESFNELYNNTKPGKKFTYSRLKVLNTYIPTIVVLAHSIGLTKSLELAGIKYDFGDKKQVTENMDSIKFADGYLRFENTYASSMLLNGLKDCNTEDYNIAAVNTKAMWVEMLDNFGGRIKSDGLDNFNDLLFDPLTIDICHDYKLPDNYVEALIYANNLLIDNKYVKQTDLISNRFRTNEAIAVHFYKCLSASYKDYAIQSKIGRNVPMSIKQDAIIDSVLSSNTTSDLSIFQPLFEIESKNGISFKGVVGMNQERSYGIDKRGYDQSMLNIISQSTGFANTVGMNRQTTIDPEIMGGRGYFKKSNLDEISVTKTYSMTEALSPFTLTSDDPFRNAMTFVQTSKHTTPIEYGTPQLVTTGASAAMPYLSSDMYCHKAKKSGKVKEIVPGKYLLVQYNDGTTEYVSLTERTMKNSDGGFYVGIELVTDLKVGQTVKEQTILAYDKKSFSNKVGDGKQLEYNIGCLAKVACFTTEDGFEDSGVCGEWLTEAMSSEIIIQKDKNLDPQANILFMAKPGQAINEGEPILIYQNAYDEEDANLLLKTLNNEDDEVSSIGRNVVKSKVTGIVQDIKIFRTVELDELSDSLRKIVSAKEREINKYKSIANKAENETNLMFDPVGKLPMSGKLKNVNGVRIEIYLKYYDKLSVGDKCAVNAANKVILMNIYDDKDSPYTDFRPNEQVDLLSSASSLDGRMITSNIKLGATNKLMIELSRVCKEKLGIKWNTLHEIYYKNKK